MLDLPPALRALLLVSGLLGAATPAGAHSYPDPALRTVLDEVRPPLPSGVRVELVPSVVDSVVLTAPQPQPLEVLGPDGLPYVRVSATGVEGNVAHPWWFTTAVPEGGPAVPASARLGSVPRWVRVSTGTTWSVFDPRVRPAVELPDPRDERESTLADWQIPLRYDGKPVEARGRVLRSPVRGGLVVAVTEQLAGLVATPLQGPVPGLLVQVPAGREVVVLGIDGQPFLRFGGGRVLARRESPSWRADQQARGRVGTGSGWVEVAQGVSASWLDPRLRYAREVPPEDVITRRTVVHQWVLPVLVDGARGEVRGTVTWVPRAEGVGAVTDRRRAGAMGWVVGLVAGGSLLVASVLLVRRRTKKAPG